MTFAHCSFVTDNPNIGADFLALFLLRLSLDIGEDIPAPTDCTRGYLPVIRSIQEGCRQRYLQSESCGIPLRGYVRLANALEPRSAWSASRILVDNVYPFHGSYLTCLRDGGVRITVSRPYLASVLDEVKDDDFRWVIHAAARMALHHISAGR